MLRVEQDPEMAPIIKKIFQMYAKGTYSYLQVCEYLHSKGIQTANGQPLAYSTIHQIINNEFYYGMMVSKKQT